MKDYDVGKSQSGDPAVGNGVKIVERGDCYHLKRIRVGTVT